MDEKILRIEEVSLDLMDWKGMETESENQIRDAKKIVALGEIARTAAKKQIKSFGGLTSEEERAKEKIKIAELKKESTS